MATSKVASAASATNRSSIFAFQRIPATSLPFLIVRRDLSTARRQRERPNTDLQRKAAER